MLREQIRPVSDTDAAISDMIAQGTQAALNLIRSRVPDSVFSFFDQLFEGDAAAGEGNWSRVAEALREAGLLASAVAAQDKIIGLDIDYSRRAAAYADKAEIERKMSMTWAAAADLRVANRLRGYPNTDGLFLELEEGELSVRAARIDPDEYARLVASQPNSPLLDDPLRDPTLTRYVNQTQPTPGAGPAVDDCSFFVVDGDGVPLVQVEANARGDRYLGCHETAIVITRLAPSHPLIADAEVLAVRQIEFAFEWCGCKLAIFESRPSNPISLALRAWIATKNYWSIPYTAGWIDLTLSEAEIEAGYRTAHRQSLRWGRNNMRVVKTTTPDPALLDHYVQVYRDAGRGMPALPMDLLVRFLNEGRCNLYVGYFEDQPVVALLSSRHGITTYYWASAKKIIGNKPLGHVVLHQAIVDAKAEGQKRFDFGPMHIAETFSQKLRSISLYKRGFASNTEEMAYLAVTR